jgi:hypothetical protein
MNAVSTAPRVRNRRNVPAWILAGFLSFMGVLPAAAAAQDGGRIVAEVSNENGQPIQGAAVQVTGTAVGSLTDAGGRATLGPIAPGSYEVRASQLGYVPQVVEVVVSAGQIVRAFCACARAGAARGNPGIRPQARHAARGGPR